MDNLISSCLHLQFNTVIRHKSLNLLRNFCWIQTYPKFSKLCLLSFNFNTKKFSTESRTETEFRTGRRTILLPHTVTQDCPHNSEQKQCSKCTTEYKKCSGIQNVQESSKCQMVSVENAKGRNRMENVHHIFVFTHIT